MKNRRAWNPRCRAGLHDKRLPHGMTSDGRCGECTRRYDRMRKRKQYRRNRQQ